LILPRISIEILYRISRTKRRPDATLEIVADENSMRNIRDADEAWDAGRVQEFTSWNKVKRHV